jgi:hypothetical protein
MPASQAGRRGFDPRRPLHFSIKNPLKNQKLRNGPKSTKLSFWQKFPKRSHNKIEKVPVVLKKWGRR